MLVARCPAIAQTRLQVDVNLKNLQSDSDQLKVNDAADIRDHHQNSDLLLLGDGLFPSHLRLLANSWLRVPLPTYGSFYPVRVL